MKKKEWTKKCRVCGVVKPGETGFYVCKGNRDGRYGKCIECYKAYVNMYREANIERIRKYDRERFSTYKRKAKVREYISRYKEKYPDKVAARNRLYSAIKRGVLQKMPCEVCGENKSEAHHDDYSRPLEVRWLCRYHHGLLHGHYKYGTE
jgi:hypothetical protein